MILKFGRITSSSFKIFFNQSLVLVLYIQIRFKFNFTKISHIISKFSTNIFFQKNHKQIYNTEDILISLNKNIPLRFFQIENSDTKNILSLSISRFLCFSIFVVFLFFYLVFRPNIHFININ